MPRPDRLTWIKFNPADWLGDRRLIRCSLAAKGLWIDIVCMAASVDPDSDLYGHAVTTNTEGQIVPLSTQMLANECGATREEVEMALEELGRNGVFSRTKDGIIYSRRLVRDRQAYLEAASNGSKGGKKSQTRWSRQVRQAGVEGGVELESESEIRVRDKNQSKSQDEGQDKTNLKELAFDRLAKVARIDLSKLRRNSAWITFPTVYDGWVSAGCDPEKDIWPTVEKMILSFQASTPGKSLPFTPAYLNQTVLMARDNRLKAEANGTAKVGGRFGKHMVEGYEGKPWLLTDKVVVMLAKAWGEGRWAREFGRTPADPKCSLPPEFIKELLAIRPREGNDVWWAPPGKPDGWV